MSEYLKWVENVGGSGLNVGHYKDGSVIIVDGFESIRIEEEHLDVILGHLQKIRDLKKVDDGWTESLKYVEGVRKSIEAAFRHDKEI